MNREGGLEVKTEPGQTQSRARYRDRIAEILHQHLMTLKYRDIRGGKNRAGTDSEQSKKER